MSQKPPNPDPDFFTEKMWDYALRPQLLSHTRDQGLHNHPKTNSLLAHVQPASCLLGQPLESATANNLLRFAEMYAIQQYSPGRCPDLCQHMADNLEEWKTWAQDLLRWL